jgi:hypothetical protein
VAMTTRQAGRLTHVEQRAYPRPSMSAAWIPGYFTESIGSLLENRLSVRPILSAVNHDHRLAITQLSPVLRKDRSHSQSFPA